MSTQRRSAATAELTWVKSSYSGPNGGDCVEVAVAPGAIRVRDSKRADGPAIRVHRHTWPAFLAYVTGTDTGA